MTIKRIIIYFNLALLLLVFNAGKSYTAELRYFMDYSMAGGGVSTSSYYADLNAKAGIFITDNWSVGAGLGLIYYDAKINDGINIGDEATGDSFKIKDGGFELFLTTQYNLSERWFVFAQGGLSSLSGHDMIGHSSSCENESQWNTLDFKNLGFAELGVGFIFTQGTYLAISYKGFAQDITINSTTFTLKGKEPPEYDETHTISHRNQLNHTISIRIGIYIDEIYSGLDYYK